MKLRKLGENIFTRKREITERMFILTSFISAAALFILLIEGIILGKSMQNIIILAGALVILSAAAYYTVRYDLIQAGAGIISSLIIFVFLPLLFFTGGGIRSGASLWFIYCTLFISLIIRGKMRVFLLVSDALMAVGCYYTGFSFPQIVYINSTVTAYVDSLLSLILVGTLVGITVAFEIYCYKEESRYSNEQKKRVEELNAAQNRFFSR